MRSSDTMVLGCIAAGKVLFHLLLTGRYGYFRDELYFLACSEHLAWGYADLQPLSIVALAVVLAANAMWSACSSAS